MSRRTVTVYTCSRCGIEDDGDDTIPPDEWNQLTDVNDKVVDLCRLCAVSYDRWFRMIDSNAEESK